MTPRAIEIVEAVAEYEGWRYGRGYHPDASPPTIDCSTLTGRLLCTVLGVAVGGKLYQAVVLYLGALEALGVWAPIVALVDAVHGAEVNLRDLRPGEVALVQEWRRLPRTLDQDDPGAGHAYLVIGTSTPGRVHLLESTSYTAAGVSWRGVNADTGERYQSRAVSHWPPPTVPIDSLGRHRAAVLFPRAGYDEAEPAPTTEAAVPLTLPPGIDLDEETAAGALELAALLVARGASIAHAADQVAKLVDDAIDWTELLPGVAGQLAEAGDGPAVRALVLLFARSIRSRAGELGKAPASLRILRRQRERVEAGRRLRAEPRTPGA